MENLEKVEKLRKKADISYEEAKEILEECDWDLLDAVIKLESMGKLGGSDPVFCFKISTELRQGHCFCLFSQTGLRCFSE